MSPSLLDLRIPVSIIHQLCFPIQEPSKRFTQEIDNLHYRLTAYASWIAVMAKNISRQKLFFLHFRYILSHIQTGSLSSTRIQELRILNWLAIVVCDGKYNLINLYNVLIVFVLGCRFEPRGMCRNTVKANANTDAQDKDGQTALMKVYVAISLFVPWFQNTDHQEIQIFQTSCSLHSWHDSFSAHKNHRFILCCLFWVF